jgi:hypothetical protein
MSVTYVVSKACRPRTVMRMPLPGRAYPSVQGSRVKHQTRTDWAQKAILHDRHCHGRYPTGWAHQPYFTMRRALHLRLIARLRVQHRLARLQADCPLYSEHELA